MKMKHCSAFLSAVMCLSLFSPAVVSAENAPSFEEPETYASEVNLEEDSEELKSEVEISEEQPVIPEEELPFEEESVIEEEPVIEEVPVENAELLNEEPELKKTLHIETSEKVLLTAGAIPSQEDKWFAGWATEENGNVVYPAYQKAEIDSPTDLYAVFTDEPEKSYLDINARVDGAYRGSTSGVATFDVYIDGSLIRSAATDFYKNYPAGTEYRIENVQVEDGYTFAGMYHYRNRTGTLVSDSLTGRIMAGGVNDATLVFVSDEYTGTAGNVARYESAPKITEDIVDDKTYVVTSRPTESSAFKGWSFQDDGSAVSEWSDMNYLDVNAKINGRNKGNTSNIAAFNVFINGELSSHNATDYYKKWPEGTPYRIEVTDVNTKYAFNGAADTVSSSAYVYGGGVEGNVKDSKTEALLLFDNRIVKLTTDLNFDGGSSDYREMVAGTSVRIPYNKTTRKGYLFAGWATEPDGEAVYAQSEKITVNDDLTLYAVWKKTNYVDINGTLNGKYIGNLSSYLTFDILADGKIVADDVSDFYRAFPVGTKIEVTDITPKEGSGIVVTGASERRSYGGTYHQSSLAFTVAGEAVNDVLLQLEEAGPAITGITASLREGVSDTFYTDSLLFPGEIVSLENYFDVIINYENGDTAPTRENLSLDRVSAPAEEGPFDVVVSYTADDGKVYQATVTLNAVHPEPIFLASALSNASGYAGSVNGVSLKKIVFTDIEMPKEGTARTYYVGATAKSAVKAWRMTGEEDTLYVSSGRPGVKVIYPEDPGMTVNVGFIEELDARMLDTSRITQMPRWTANGGGFQNGVKKINYSGCDFSNVESLNSSFNSYTSLEYVDLSNCKFTNVTSLAYMFMKTPNLIKVDMSGTEFTPGKVENLEYVFANSGIQELDLGGLETSGVTNTTGMFENAKKIVHINLSNCDLSNVESAPYMFNNCAELTGIDFHSAGMPNLKGSLRQMFDSCTKLQDADLSGINFANVNEVFRVLFDCRSLQTTLNIDATNFSANQGYTFANMAIGDNANVIVNCTQASREILENNMIWATSYGYVQHVTYNVIG